MPTTQAGGAGVLPTTQVVAGGTGPPYRIPLSCGRETHFSFPTTQAGGTGSLPTTQGGGTGFLPTTQAAADGTGPPISPYRADVRHSAPCPPPKLVEQAPCPTPKLQLAELGQKGGPHAGTGVGVVQLKVSTNPQKTFPKIKSSRVGNLGQA